ncbi:MAG: hypothetical protein WC745_05120 [Patescibacteria group bacterium]|jgi:predicted glycosyl hydrolase (DUF1957 family)
MLWINFLHFYQPANLEPEKIIEAAKKSYERIIRRLEKNPDAKFTANISGCLLLRLDEELKYGSLIKRISRLVKEGRLELTGSAAYHALLPLVKEEVAKEQILQNEEILKKYFGSDLKLPGFFLPEMAWSEKIARIIKNLGYEWIILDEISARGKLGAIDCGKVYRDEKSGLDVIFRNRQYSSGFVPGLILKQLEKESEKTIVTATDAELYGLRHSDTKNSLKELMDNPSVKTLTVSSFIKDRAGGKEPVNLIPCSWESTEEELARNKPYALWDNDDIIHNKLWELADLAQDIYLNHKNKDESFWSRWHLFRGLASCTFWWASGKDFREIFGPVAWNPDETEKGVNELVRSVRSLEKHTSLEVKLSAERLALDIKKMIWERHWKQYN